MKSNQNIVSDKGAQENLRMAYNQQLNKVRAEIFKKFIERVHLITRREEDPLRRTEELPEDDLKDIEMNEALENQFN